MSQGYGYEKRRHLTDILHRLFKWKSINPKIMSIKRMKKYPIKAYYKGKLRCISLINFTDRIVNLLENGKEIQNGYIEENVVNKGVPKYCIDFDDIKFYNL